MLLSNIVVVIGTAQNNLQLVRRLFSLPYTQATLS